MAYQINKTDGTIVATVADGQIDQLSTDLTLIGKNYSGFGEYFNENLVKMLENFASTTRPTHPIRGQIWYDTADLKLKVSELNISIAETGIAPVPKITEIMRVYDSMIIQLLEELRLITILLDSSLREINIMNRKARINTLSFHNTEYLIKWHH